MSKPIPDEIIAAARQDYLSGKSIRQVALDRKVSLRTLSRRMVDENWEKERQVFKSKCDIVASTGNRLATIVAASDERALKVAQNATQKLRGVLDTVANVTSTVANLISKQDLTQENYKDLASLLHLLTQSMDRIGNMLPSRQDDSDSGVIIMVAPTQVEIDTTRYCDLVGCSKRILSTQDSQVEQSQVVDDSRPSDCVSVGIEK